MESASGDPGTARWGRHTDSARVEAEMTNPFEDPDASYLVLVNDEGQHSLWPGGIAVPEGWTIARDHGTREECLDYINENWTDMRPKSLIEAMRQAS